MRKDVFGPMIGVLTSHLFFDRLIAIMIGQLVSSRFDVPFRIDAANAHQKMSIPDCIESYGKLSQNVFGSKSFCAKVFGYYGAAIVGGTEYHSKAFEKEVQKLLDHHLPLDQKKLLSQSTSISKAKLLLPLSLQAEYPKVYVSLNNVASSSIVQLAGLSAKNGMGSKICSRIAARGRQSNSAHELHHESQQPVQALRYIGSS